MKTFPKTLGQSSARSRIHAQPPQERVLRVLSAFKTKLHGSASLCLHACHLPDCSRHSSRILCRSASKAFSESYDRASASVCQDVDARATRRRLRPALLNGDHLQTSSARLASQRIQVTRRSPPQSRCRAHTLRRMRAAPAKARKQRRSARPAARCTGAARTCSCAQLAVGAACAQSAPYAAPSGALIRRSFAISARGSPKVARTSRRLPPWPTSSARSAAV